MLSKFDNQLQVAVLQGNGKGKSIYTYEQSILYTQELTPCTAILIIGKNKNYLIHSDANDFNGVGKVNLQYGIERLIYSFQERQEVYKLAFIGGSIASIQKKQEIINKILPNSIAIYMEAEARSAYLSAKGEFASSKKKFIANYLTG